MRAEAERLQAQPPKAPVIVAGVTGADPAASELMRGGARLPNGALVLPALDQTLDDDSWARDRADASRASAVRLDEAARRARPVAREHVQPLPGAKRCDRPAARGASLACEAMRPAGTTERWHRFVAGADKTEMAAALIGRVEPVEAADGEDEAEAIALILREAVETPGRTAALVSPDRRWRAAWRRGSKRGASTSMTSAGRPFAKTEPGAFLDLVGASGGDASSSRVALMTLLKHPLCRLGMTRR